MTPIFYPPVLAGKGIQLEPLSPAHETPLFEAAQCEKIWAYSPVNGMGKNFKLWFTSSLKKSQTGEQIPFAVRRISDQSLIGSTRLYHIDMTHKRSAIGYTWYIPEMWGSKANIESKYLLLKYAFEILKLNRIEFSTDSRHGRVHASLEKLGAKKEGTLRQHMLLEDGTIRDSVIFSIILSEWEFLKNSLEKKLAN